MYLKGNAFVIIIECKFIHELVSAHKLVRGTTHWWSVQEMLELALLGSGVPVVGAWVEPLELPAVEPVGCEPPVELGKVLPDVGDPVPLVEPTEVLNEELAEVLKEELADVLPDVGVSVLPVDPVTLVPVDPVAVVAVGTVTVDPVAVVAVGTVTVDPVAVLPDDPVTVDPVAVVPAVVP